MRSRDALGLIGTWSVVFALGAAGALAGCTSSPGTGDTVTSDAAEASVADSSPDVMLAPRCTASTVPCQDQQIQNLGLFDTANPAMITQVSSENGVFVHEVDATAGGMTPTQSFVYARFTPEGLEKVNISDEDAFTSLDWDISFRRFIIRVNSGVSGPSCVEAGRTAPGTMFDSLTAAPENLVYRTEEYFTPSCDPVPDGSGLGSPSTALSSFWTYSTCVQMTGNVYVIRLRDGRTVRLQVLSYYSPNVQEQCNDTGGTTQPSGAGHLRVRWSFLGG